MTVGCIWVSLAWTTVGLEKVLPLTTLTGCILHDDRHESPRIITHFPAQDFNIGQADDAAETSES